MRLLVFPFLLLPMAALPINLSNSTIIRWATGDAIKLGLHDYSVQRTVSRREGSFVFNAGTWQAKAGDRPFRGYYSSILTSESGKPKIIEETVTVAAP